MLEDATQWAEENREAKQHALREAGLDGSEPLPDAIAADPAKLVAAAKALAIEAVRRDAPAGVVEELLVPIRRMTATLQQLDRYRFTADVLAGMRGLRDETELEPVLAKALDDAPDEANREKLEHMLGLVRTRVAFEVLGGIEKVLPPEGTTGEFTTAKLEPSRCVPCCALGCIVCPEFCPVCCLAGCFLC
jgi:hypothetical protein